MKKIVLAGALFFLIGTVYSQELMKIKDVFDFEVNDEFHYKDGFSVSAPPNGDRVKVLAKKFSENNDTIFYQLRHDRYNSTPVNTELHLEYHFSTDTTNLTITRLDSSLYYFDIGFSADTITEQAFCNTLTNGYEYVAPETWEGNVKRRIYGKGIGMCSDFHQDWAGADPQSSVKVDRRLVYYKKGTTECGEADLTISVKNMKDQMAVSIYPNPVSNVLFIKGLPANDKVKIEMVDMKGTVVDLFYSETKNVYSYNTSRLPQGSYLVRISSDDNQWFQKVFIKR